MQSATESALTGIEPATTDIELAPANVVPELNNIEPEPNSEAYEFKWVGKRAALAEARRPCTRTMRPCPMESVNWDSTQNLYIEGDCLDALKLLREGYRGKVRMIYIDPPYNTGKSLTYRDNFKMQLRDWNAKSQEIDDAGNRLTENNQASGRFHSDWCSMITARLIPARELLSDDGVIFISIGDNEVYNLKKICDEIFGEDNYICPFIWEKGQHFGRQKLNSYENNDFILCYAKALHRENGEIKELLAEKIKRELEDAPLYNKSNNFYTLEFPPLSTKFNIKDGVYERTTSSEYELLAPVTIKDGLNANPLILRFRSRWSNDTIAKEVAKGTTFWVRTEKFAIRAIYNGSRISTQAPKQIIFTNESNPLHARDRFGNKVETNEKATSALAKLMQGEYFSYPKPVALIRYLCSLIYDEKAKDFPRDFIVLDFFSGSATTAHAVMQLNDADGGKRRFIMVQLPERCAADSQAYKAGYQNICEIGKERLRRAGRQIVANHQIIAQDQLANNRQIIAPDQQTNNHQIIAQYQLAYNRQMVNDNQMANDGQPAAHGSAANAESSPPDVGFRVYKID